MTALASVDDVEVALGRKLLATENIDNLLETASDLVAAFLGGRPDPVPGEVVRVVADVVVAVLLKPATTTADYKAGGYYQQREVTTVMLNTEQVTTVGPWLSKSQKMRLRQFRVRGQFGRLAYSIALADDDWVYDPGYIDVPAYLVPAHQLVDVVLVGSAMTTPVFVWAPNTEYKNGDLVMRNNIVYRANWWTDTDPELMNGADGSGMPWSVQPHKAPKAT